MAKPAPTPQARLSLCDRHPVMSIDAMLAHFVPPEQFAQARLENYVPDPLFPSQDFARTRAEAFVKLGGAKPAKRWGGGLKTTEKAGIYLDGGFGVGKTHLLAAMWHLIPGRDLLRHFHRVHRSRGGVGDIGGAVDHLKGASFLAIDEFELDDPGDTMVMSRLLGELVATGTRVAATSNTPPAALGEGRFAAADFLREITALAEKFDTIRIDGEDYRKRDFEGHAVVVPSAVWEKPSQSCPALLPWMRLPRWSRT